MTRAGVRARGAERRRALLDATLALLGRGGPAAVTHRAVAATARVPPAATTYYFASKDELLHAAFTHAVEEDVAALRATRLVGEGERPTVPELTRRLAALMSERIRGERATLLVQYELELEAARRPELAAESRRWTDAYVDTIAPALAALGSPAPEADAWLLTAALTGIELELLASREPDPERLLLPAVERLLRALTRGGETQTGDCHRSPVAESSG